MIRALIYLGEDDERQLAELKITWMHHHPNGWARYHAEIAVDCGDEVKVMTRSFDHNREKRNVLALMEAALLELGDEEFALTGKMERHPNRMSPIKELGMLFKSLGSWDD